MLLELGRYGCRNRHRPSKRGICRVNQLTSPPKAARSGSELGNGLADWEELPELRSLLEQNFVEDEQGRWYVPDPKKAEDLEKLRRRSLLREFEAYLSGSGKLTKFRSEAVRAGFDDAWDRREFELIVKLGKRLPSDVLVDDPTLRYFVDNAEILVGG